VLRVAMCFSFQMLLKHRLFCDRPWPLDDQKPETMAG
jgi:hypothetical protein